MSSKTFIQTLGFKPKENTLGIFYKNYNNYIIEINFENAIFNYGNKIKCESKTTQNFSQAENWVVLECVDRLLEKGYMPEQIILEKTWKTGHGTSGRLDILVTRFDGTAYLMIECKTYGAEFDKELKNIERNGGQLFTYFQQDKDADVLILYTSQLLENKIDYKNIIIKIEDDYRQAGNVKDFFERWNKLHKLNGIFDTWVNAYEFQSKALTKNDLKVLKQDDSNFIFSRFLEILRHNVVSDKPNAFNKIFTLFLCKIVDENRNKTEELHFQWIEGIDNNISFQKRLTDLYNRGMLELLEKKVTDVSDKEFDKRFFQVELQYREKFKDILTEIRLKKNNEFAIKEVYDNDSFEENAKVVKEVVELLQVYQIRYNYRQPFLSDFFELLLTTGLKQESGQFFTPVPIARFIIKSLPFQEITAHKLEQGNKNDLLPTIIDYAAGSGHFLTESMEELQNYIDSVDESNYTPTTKRAIEKWKVDQFDWAKTYVYGIEKDYRLVKTAKVSCYLHGDGLAKVIHGDGLGDFATSKVFKDLLKETDKNYVQDNKQFDIIISNPPYSVSAFKGLMDTEKSEKAFNLYSRLTDQSSEIECLFIERTKQLLKDGGVAGIILPSSILSNTGIYTQTREILLKNFEILGIAELGSNTFMATGTNTVTLFLRRRNNADAYNVEEAIKKCFVSSQDLTINSIENPLAKYVAYVWATISFEDYKTLLQQLPNDNIAQHEIYKEYVKKIKAKNKQELLVNILAMELEKLLYFILAYAQKFVLIKTGEKDEEKRFLGYEFSNRRGSAGIHPTQRSKTIDECTELYDAKSFTNPQKASYYIYKAFLGIFNIEIPTSLQPNISYHNLVDTFTFDRADFEKNISLTVKKKVKFESKWQIIKLNQVVSIVRGASPRPIKAFITHALNGYNWIKIGDVKPKSKYITSTKEKITKEGAEKSRFVKPGDFILSNSMSFGRPYIMSIEGYIHDGWLLLNDFSTLIIKDYLYYLLTDKIIQEQFIDAASGGTSVNNLNIDKVAQTLIPLPPLDIQQKIVFEIEELDMKEVKIVAAIKKLKENIALIINQVKKGNLISLGDISEIKKGTSITKDKTTKGNIPVIAGGKEPAYFHNVANRYGNVITVSASGANAGFVRYFTFPIFASDCNTIISKDENVISTFLIYKFLENQQTIIYKLQKGQAQPHVYGDDIKKIQIPLPIKSEQLKIVAEIKKIESEITELENKLNVIPKQKEKILKKYLN